MKLRNVRGVRTALVGTTVVTVAALALSGCGAGGSSSSAEGDDLTVLVEGGGLAELQPIADLYE
ncbi:MAG TPA: hypothetical protein VGD39_06815, partial [Nocardioides sp.]